MCPENEMKNRKRAKIAMMRQTRAKMPAKAVELPRAEDMPDMECVKLQVGEAHEEQCGTNQKTVESIEPSVPEDSTSALKQLRLTIKNTFIHVEFPDILEASTLPAEDDLVVTAGVLFRARQWK